MIGLVIVFGQVFAQLAMYASRKTLIHTSTSTSITFLHDLQLNMAKLAKNNIFPLV